MTPEEEEIARIDRRIRLSQRKTRAMGTVVSRDTTGPAATVRHDDADTPTPALVPGSVFCQPGDWVTLDLYGTQWVVSNSFSGPGFGEASKRLNGLGSTTGDLTSGSFVDLSEFGSFQFDKLFDNTFVQFTALYSAYLNTGTNTKVEWAVRLTPIAGGVGYTPSDLTVGSLMLNPTLTHLSQTTERRSIGIPAGSYTVSLRWRRESGTGTPRADGGDSYYVGLDERVRAGAPVL